MRVETCGDCAVWLKAALIPRTVLMKIGVFLLMALGCGVPGPKGDPGEPGGDWAREEVYCRSSSVPDRTQGERFEILVTCAPNDFPVSASCYVENPQSLRTLGGEYLNWEGGNDGNPRYDCAFEWVGTPPEKYSFSVEAKAQICCVRNTQPLEFE